MKSQCLILLLLTITKTMFLVCSKIIMNNVEETMLEDHEILAIHATIKIMRYAELNQKDVRSLAVLLDFYLEGLRAESVETLEELRLAA